MFSDWEIEGWEIRCIEYEVPERHATMNSYARQLAKQIDTSQNFALAGVSLGGMLAIEMTDWLDPRQVILISSAANSTEIPGLYRFFRHLPLHRILGGNFYKFSTLALQPLFEPMPRQEAQLFRSMIKDTEPKFMRRVVRCIVEWDRVGEVAGVIHIHGTKDRTLPIRHTTPDLVVEGGTHVMVHLLPERVMYLISSILNET